MMPGVFHIGEYVTIKQSGPYHGIVGRVDAFSLDSNGMILYRVVDQSGDWRSFLANELRLATEADVWQDEEAE